jgi:hypothetical protein
MTETRDFDPTNMAHMLRALGYTTLPTQAVCPCCGARLPAGAGMPDQDSSWPRVYCGETCYAMRAHVRI